METLQTKTRTHTRRMAIIKYNLVFAIPNMKRTLKSHLRQKYELRTDHTILFIEFVSY